MAKASKSYEYHPLSKKFPRMAPDVFKAFSADIALRGLDKPIELLDGMIFDGRHRYEACLTAGIEPRFVELADGTDADSYVKAANALRRHLTQDELAEWLVEKRNGSSPDGAGDKNPTPPSNRQLAKDAGIDRKAIDRADKIEKNATPEVKAAVADGTITRRDAAAVADNTPAVQDKAVHRVRTGKAKTATAAVKGGKGKEVKSTHAHFKGIESHFGSLRRATTSLKKTCPAAKFERIADDLLERFLSNLKDWERAVK
jgi:hypothetical protein